MSGRRASGSSALFIQPSRWMPRTILIDMTRGKGTLAHLAHCQITGLERKNKMHGLFMVPPARLGIIVAAALSLSACGRSPGERALSGGLIGAGGGAALGAATGMSPLTGAVIGGTVGAVGGAVTAPRR